MDMKKYRMTVRAIIYRGGKILAAKHNDKTTGRPTDYWATVGGGLDYNETLTDGIIREITEELGIKAKVGRLLLCAQWLSTEEQMEFVEFFFLINNPEDFLSIDLAKTSHGLDEISEIKFVNPKEVNIRPKILSELDFQDICENVREVHMVSYL
jgi:ADP-ribose pyrophosphatase YjhB (NUDIX family)